MTRFLELIINSSSLAIALAIPHRSLAESEPVTDNRDYHPATYTSMHHQHIETPLAATAIPRDPEGDQPLSEVFDFHKPILRDCLYLAHIHGIHQTSASS
ncbi:hypothetical protein R3P38DRAFT_2842423 [Favolaschia claudopus]|uniref:Secreted protein n=1 Tax=Favolaschia claudopus TaxID=2862362 RepID=A0AAW0E1H1_9AGAR